jgi:hypothetical protein
LKVTALVTGAAGVSVAVAVREAEPASALEKAPAASPAPLVPAVAPPAASQEEAITDVAVAESPVRQMEAGERIAAALVRLEEMGLARKVLREGESREGVVWIASSPFAMNEFYEQGEAGRGGGEENS